MATPAARAQLLLGMLSFFMILSLLTGGMYLAIDTTVGERERGTLEPLLAAPVPRESLLLGKLLATSAYMLLSLTVTTGALCAALGRIDIEQFGMSADLGLRTALSLIAITAPLVPLMAAGMTLIAAWTRSAREAQAWLGFLQLIPDAAAGLREPAEPGCVAAADGRAQPLAAPAHHAAAARRGIAVDLDRGVRGSQLRTGRACWCWSPRGCTTASGCWAEASRPFPVDAIPVDPA